MQRDGQISATLALKAALRATISPHGLLSADTRGFQPAGGDVARTEEHQRDSSSHRGGRQRGTGPPRFCSGATPQVSIGLRSAGASLILKKWNRRQPAALRMKMRAPPARNAWKAVRRCCVEMENAKMIPLHPPSLEDKGGGNITGIIPRFSLHFRRESSGTGSEESPLLPGFLC